MQLKSAVCAEILLPAIILLFIFSGYTLCGQSIAKEDIREFRINPANARGGKCAQFFERVNYIPLETTKESIFGQIGKLEVTDRYFIILDNDANKIMIFEKKGKFHAKIKLPILRGGSFTIDRTKNEILVTIPLEPPYGGEMRRYDYDGMLITSLKVKYFIGNFIFIGSSFLTYVEHSPKRKRNDTAFSYYLFYSNDLNSFSKKLMPLPFNLHLRDYPNLNYYSNGNFFSLGNDSSCIFTKPYDYTAYELDSNRVRRQYKFIFPLEYTFITDADSTLHSKEFQEKQSKLINARSSKAIISLNNFYKVNNYLLFNASNNQSPNSLIFNMRTQELILYDRITSDSISYFLPIYNVETNIQACYLKNIYTSFSSLAMFDASTKTANKNPKYNPVLQHYFKKGSKRDNPVIVEIGLQ